MNRRKIIHIAASESEESCDRLALCDDGSVWEYVWAKTIYKDVPATPERNFSTREKVGVEPATWARLADIPQDKETK